MVRKMLVVMLLAAILLLLCVGCNRPVIDTVWMFDRVQIKMPDGTIVSGKVDTWRDFEDGDMLQVKIDGVTYLTHSTNVVLWCED